MLLLSLCAIFFLRFKAVVSTIRLDRIDVYVHNFELEKTPFTCNFVCNFSEIVVRSFQFVCYMWHKVVRFGIGRYFRLPLIMVPSGKLTSEKKKKISKFVQDNSWLNFHYQMFLFFTSIKVFSKFQLYRKCVVNFSVCSPNLNME